MAVACVLAALLSEPSIAASTTQFPKSRFSLMCCSKSFKVVTERNSRQQITCHNFRIHLQIKGKEALRVELDLTTQLLTSLGKVLTFRSSQIFSFSSFISGAPKTPEYSTPAKDFITFMFFSSASSVQPCSRAGTTSGLQPRAQNVAPSVLTLMKLQYSPPAT